jgi:RHS repeat-associated protein
LSNRLVTNSAGSATETLGTYPFGESWYNATNDKLIFTTYERDAESGNDYAMARSYANRLGGFQSPDPLSGSLTDPQSLNHYSYVSNDPTNSLDPSGAFTLPGLGLQLISGGVDFLGDSDEFSFTDQTPVGDAELWNVSDPNYGPDDLETGEFLSLQAEGVATDLGPVTLYETVGLLISGDGGFGSGAQQARLLLLKPKCARFISNLAYTAAPGADSIDNLLSFEAGATGTIADTLDQTTYTKSSDNPQTTLPNGTVLTDDASTETGSRAVTLYSGYFLESPVAQGQTYLHEAIHDGFGYSDQQIAYALTGKSYANDKNGTGMASAAWNALLAKNCK